MKKLLYILIMLLPICSLAQDDEIFERLTATKNVMNKLTYYSVGSYSVTSDDVGFTYGNASLNMAYSLYNVKDDKKEVDSLLAYENIVVKKKENRVIGIDEYITYYFVKSKNNTALVVQFNALNKEDRAFERKIIELIVENKIPTKCFEDQELDTLNFIDRKFAVEKSCAYKNVNSVQCLYKGQVSWSIHKSFKDAQEMSDIAYAVTKNQAIGKITFDDYIDVIFEGKNAKARKIVFDFTDKPDMVKSLENAKSITVYYVTAKVREKYVSCVLSAYDNDELNENGLPYLLSKVMTIK